MAVDQLDLFGPAAAPAPALPARPAVPIVAPPRPSPASAVAGVSADSLAALAGVELAEELTGDRVALHRVGWRRAMAHRAHLVGEQLAGTLTPGDAAALAALQALQLAWVGETASGETIVPGYALAALADALAGLRIAARIAASAPQGESAHA